MIASNDMLQQPVAQAIGWALLHFVWQGAAIGVLTAALLVALRRSAADVRYVVASIAMALMLTIPVVTVIQTLKPSAPSPATAAEPAVPFEPTRSSPASRVAESHEARVPLAQGGVSTPGPDSVEAWLPLFVGVWLAGVVVLTLRLLSAWVWVQRMKSHAVVPAGQSIDRLAHRLLRRLHITRTVRFLQSSLVDVPTVIGSLRPVVLLPVSVLAGLSTQQLEAILAHELAHIRRHDYLVNLLQTLVETLLFYHPAVWWLSRRIRVERENCCDDLAVSLCGDPVTYAAALAELEGLRKTGGQLVLAASGGSLVQRVRRLLGAPSHDGRAPGWLAAGAAVLVMVAIAAGVTGRDGLSADVTEESAAVGTLVSDDKWPPPPPPPAPPAPPVAPANDQGARSIDDSLRLAADARSVSGADRKKVAVLSRRQMATMRCVRLAREAARVSGQGAWPLQPACEALESFRLMVSQGVDALLKVGRAAPAKQARSATDDQDAVATVAPARATTTRVESARTEITRVQPAQAVGPVPEVARATTVPTEAALAEVIRAIEAAQVANADRVAPAGQTSISRSNRDGQRSGNFTWSHNGERLSVDYRGDIEFTDDDSDVRSITDGGWLTIRDGGRFFWDNTVEFKARPDGTLERRFWQGRSERPFDPDGRKWLAQRLPRFIRQTGIGAPARVARIMKSKGVAGVFAEISLIEGSWAKRLYFSELLKTPSLAAQAVPQALAQAGREIDSDFELASLLISVDHLVTDDATRRAYFDAARTIDSDFEMRRAFASALKKGPLAPAILASMLDASTAISSDFEQASLLVQVAKLQPLDGTTRTGFFKALATIDSAFEHRRVLTAVLQRSDLSSEVLGSTLDSVVRISSDFEAASVLLQFAKEHPIEGSQRAAFFKAASGIDSSFERGRVLEAVARRSDASDETIISVIRSAHEMKSNFETSKVLLAVAGRHTLTRTARDAYIDAAANLGDHEQGRVLSALVKNERRPASR